MASSLRDFRCFIWINSHLKVQHSYSYRSWWSYLETAPVRTFSPHRLNIVWCTVMNCVRITRVFSAMDKEDSPFHQYRKYVKNHALLISREKRLSAVLSRGSIQHLPIVRAQSKPRYHDRREILCQCITYSIFIRWSRRLLLLIVRPVQ